MLVKCEPLLEGLLCWEPSGSHCTVPAVWLAVEASEAKACLRKWVREKARARRDWCSLLSAHTTVSSRHRSGGRLCR